MKFLGTKRKKIVVATTISASGLIKAGGTNVNNGFYMGLSDFFDIELLLIAGANEKKHSIKLGDNITEIVVPKSRETDSRIRNLTAQVKAKTLYDIGLLRNLKYTPEYIDELKRHIVGCDAVIVDRPYLYNIVSELANGRPIIQKSQNIEYYFRKSNMSNDQLSELLLQELYDTEEACCRECDLSFACSEMDMETMVKMYGADRNRIKFVANGINADTAEFIDIDKRKKIKRAYLLDEYKIAIFIGGGHKPNIEACEDILKAASYCENTVFVLAGDLCSEMSKRNRPNNIILLGNISEESRKFLFSVADIALNPMHSGSGANVKMIDYMASGIPIISTRFGTRGISDISGIRIAETPAELSNMINSAELDCRAEEGIINNRKIVEEEYDWSVITAKAAEYLNEIL